ncbi:MAG: leucyl aminopeptidase [Corynebacterium sp.]|uniref:leucyl aminopeptidase n=1 Tax=Corynebacterium sp. TaxID=1720 RepID=UPI0026DCF793|nr:leucyl aminopeptidase [Corynebacterium sp.]MDO4762443.1 leucyl aminopeptidase [Corynebacterium sp.]
MTSTALPATGATTTVRLARALPEEFDALLVPVFKGEDGLELAASGLFEEDIEIAIWELLSAVGATGAAEELTRIPSIDGIDTDFILAVGLGEDAKLDDDTLRRASAAAARSLKGIKTVVTTVGTFGIQPVVEGTLLGAYSYTGHKSENPESSAPVQEVVVYSPKKSAERKFQRGVIAAEAVNLTRDLVNAPSSHLYPASYAAIIESLAAEHGLEITIKDYDTLLSEGFGGVVAVGQGSARKPFVVQLRYRAPQATKHVSFVGKGITFDTGGISIKPGASMENMISDMGGSAAVIATIIAAARMNLDVNVTATVSLAENMPDGHAFRPGDVITHYGGKTTEILNTDAEGRLVLADALVLASEDNPDVLIDCATLTGAQIVALGNRTSGVMGDKKVRNRLAEFGRKVGEHAWAMPLPEELVESMKSPVADLRNVDNTRAGGMLSAGCFLRNFVGEGIQWAHVDIAGPSFNTGSAYGYTPARATGVPVRTFIKFLRDVDKQTQKELKAAAEESTQDS